MIVWDGKDVIGAVILLVLVVAVIIMWVIYGCKKAIDKAVNRIQGFDDMEDKDD